MNHTPSTQPDDFESAVENLDLLGGPSMGQMLSGDLSPDEVSQLTNQNNFTIDHDGHVLLRDEVTGEFEVVETLPDERLFSSTTPPAVRETHETPLTLSQLIEKGAFEIPEGEPNIEMIFDRTIASLRALVMHEGHGSASQSSMGAELAEMERKFGRVKTMQTVTAALYKLQAAKTYICSAIAMIPARVAMAGLGDYADHTYRRDNDISPPAPYEGGGQENGGQDATTSAGDMGIYGGIGLMITNEIVSGLISAIPDIKSTTVDNWIKAILHGAVMFFIVAAVSPTSMFDPQTIATSALAIASVNYAKYGDKIRWIGSGPFRNKLLRIGISLASQIGGYTLLQ